MRNKRFTKEFLYKLCNEQSITLLREYDENELNAQKIIEFKCVKCNEATLKRFEFIIKYNPTCHKCSCLDKGNKARKTTLARYGVLNISQLEEIKNKKKETTLKNYGVEHNSQSDIIKKKKIQTCINNLGVEYPQQLQEVKNKSKQTCFLNYGVEHPSQSKEIKEKIKETNLKNYGVEFASQSEDFKNKVKDTCLQKYSVEYPQQSEQIRNKCKQTNLNNYGVEYSYQRKEIREKIKETIKIKYGVEYYSQTDEFKEKCRQTSLKNYGVEHPTQNEQFMEKISKRAYKIKTFSFPSGKQIKCQGYEPFALNELVKLQEEDNIITGCKNVPTIWYTDLSGKKHRHYVDIFIPNENKCIEVKSTWTFRKKKDNIFIKKNAAKDLGYDYEIWVYDNKGNRVETFV